MASVIDQAKVIVVNAGCLRTYGVHMVVMEEKLITEAAGGGRGDLYS